MVFLKKTVMRKFSSRKLLLSLFLGTLDYFSENSLSDAFSESVVANSDLSTCNLVNRRFANNFLT